MNIGWLRSVFHMLFGEEDWSLWIGRKGSTTALHKDHMHYNYLYVVAGAKRVVLVPLDQQRPYDCSKTMHRGYDCWPEVDVLSDTPSELHSVVLGPGQGLMIPPNFMHAVENVEHTIAVSYVVKPNELWYATLDRGENFYWDEL